MAIAGGTQATREQRSVTGTFSTVALVAGTANNTLSANTNRLGATLFMESGSTTFIALGGTATATGYTIRMDPGMYYELPYGFTGTVSALTPTGGTPAVIRATEFT